MTHIQIIVAETEQHYQVFENLLRKYFGWASTMTAQYWGESFDAEALIRRVMDSLDDFDYPDGRLFLAHAGTNIIGCCGLKRLVGEIGELKRLYVRPSYRKMGVGRQLVSAVIDAAIKRGYTVLRLDNPDFLIEANRLYRAMGFIEIEPYPESGLRGDDIQHYHFMEKLLP